MVLMVLTDGALDLARKKAVRLGLCQGMGVMGKERVIRDLKGGIVSPGLSGKIQEQDISSFLPSPVAWRL